MWKHYTSFRIAEEEKIDLSKVLLIVNTDRSISQQAADYYRFVRGLGNHQLSFALGNSNILSKINSYNTVVLPVADYIEANGIETVITMPGCPMFAQTNGSAGFDTISFEALLGGAKWCKIRNNNLPGNLVAIKRPKTFCSLLQSFPTTAYSTVFPFNGFSEYIEAPNGKAYMFTLTSSLSDVKAGTSEVIPFGRLGLFQHSGTPAESFETVKRIIDDAIWAENNRKRQINAVVAVHNRVNRISPPWQWMAYKMLQDYGCKTDWYANSLSTYGSWFDTPALYSYSDVYAGYTNIYADVLIGGALVNLDYTGTYANSFLPKKGSWYSEMTSYSFEQAANWIHKGGCAAICTIAEPYENSLGEPASMVNLALQGRSMAEIHYFTHTGIWRSTTIGDPLYRPFPAEESKNPLSVGTKHSLNIFKT